MESNTGMRAKIIFDDPGAFRAAQMIEAPVPIRAINLRRQAMSVDLPEDMVLAGRLPLGLPAGARVTRERVYEPEQDVDFNPFTSFVDGLPKDADMDTVLDRINARDAWRRARGEGVVIAVVDTGVHGSRPEFEGRRRKGFASDDGDPWSDYSGHGTMCAAIACASREAGGLLDGVAPRAELMPCRTTFGEVELSTIYDELNNLRQTGMPVVASNSFGVSGGRAPDPDPDNVFVEAMEDAVRAGVHVFFSAGNYHLDAGGQADACDPTTIWLHKCRNDVFTVGTCDLDDAIWSYSSRGPGQHDGLNWASRKPDVVAPTPRNGEILFGEQLVVSSIGWGTSGACPQAAGLAALLLSIEPRLSRHDLFTYMRSTARDLGHGRNCQGAGLLDCSAAIERV